jgi:predicted acetylornithine/succinylornithine family transaminase
MKLAHAQSETHTGQDLLQQVMALDDQYYLATFGRRVPLCLVRGEGVWLYDSAGRRYLDLIGGIAVNVLGHAHPRLVGAICSQAGQLIHCCNYYYNEPQARLAKRLADLSGLPGARVFIGNSGTEAIEAAIKLARGYFFHQGKPRAKIVSALKSFHGRTLAAATATGQPRYSEPFAPLPAGFVHITYNDAAALAEAVDDQTCAVLLELIQGESGILPADPAFVRQAQACCRAHGARLIIDEIQTGMGRTGRFLAAEHYGIQPDIITLAKGLAGGVPIGAVIATGETASGFVPGDHGSTFGGNPLACAAALAVLDTIEQEGLVRQAELCGNWLLKELHALTDLPQISEIRGVGLMIGIGLAQPLAVAVKNRLAERGFLVGSVGDTTIRLLPPLILQTGDLPPFLAALRQVLTEVQA